MATIRLSGPFTWVRGFGGEYLMPGKTHYWQFRPARGMVIHASAHARSRENALSTLLIEGLSVTYERTGDPFVNLLVRNVGPSGVSSYSFFVSEIDF